jgi:hypothetical protein
MIMFIKTSELQGPALDWAVAKCEGLMQGQIAIDGVSRGFYKPSTDWAQGGPIIEREKVSIRHDPKDARGAWYAVQGLHRFLSPYYKGSGPTPLIAAMRCYVASKLGDEVEVPDELITQEAYRD